jgi:hypothetical protein
MYLLLKKGFRKIANNLKKLGAGVVTTDELYQFPGDFAIIDKSNYSWTKEAKSEAERQIKDLFVSIPNSYDYFKWGFDSGIYGSSFSGRIITGFYFREL